MSEVFGPVYADAYDALYYDKDYEAECDLIERIFETYSDGAICRILDLGCGTGNHAILLAQRGYEVVGIDKSEGMLTHAQAKATDLSSKGRERVTFYQCDIRNVKLEQQFDAVLMMFAVLSYQLENPDVLAVLNTARRHLRAGGLLIFDVWYGPAVLHQRPDQRIKVIPTPKGKILRVASGELNTRKHICTVNYHLWQLEGDKVVAEAEEYHTMRYFFPLELALFLECARFALLRIGAFPEFDRDPDETTWNALVVAQRI